MNIKDRKLFVFDLDGTLLNSSHEVGEENLVALMKAKKAGHLLTVATGRNYFLTKKVLKNNFWMFDYFLGCNGSVFHDLNQKKYFKISKNVEYQLLDFLKSELKTYEGGIQISTNWKTFSLVFLNSEKEWFLEKDRFDYFDVFPSIDLMSLEDKSSIVQMSVRVNHEIIKQLRKKWAEIFPEFDFTITSKNNIDINVAGVDKLYGIKNIVNQNLVPFDNVFVFGDTQNDINGLKYYNNTFAMGNSFDEVKEAAKYIIGDNNSSAIGNIVLKNI